MNEILEVTVTDGLDVYQGPDLSSSVMAHLPKGQGVRLSDAEVHEGREWMKAAAADGATGYVLGPSARGHTTLGTMFKRCAFCGHEVRSAALKCRFCGRTLDSTLRAQEEQDEESRAREAAIRAYLRKSCVGWLVVAGIQFALAAYLSAVWGAVCVVLGAANLAYSRRSMLIVNGVAMMIVGIGNAASTLAAGKTGAMTYLGVMQLIWGFKELRRFADNDVRPV